MVKGELLPSGQLSSFYYRFPRPVVSVTAVVDFADLVKAFKITGNKLNRPPGS